MVALDDGSIARAGLDDVGVDRALGEPLGGRELGGFFLEDLDEDAADDLALLFRIGDTGEFVHEAVDGIDDDELEAHVLFERFTDLFALVLAKEAVVDEDAGELLADGAVDERGGHGGVDAAGEAENDFFVTDLLADLRDGFGDVVAHDPVGGALADVEHEAVEHFAAFERVRHLRMELDGIEALFLVAHAGDRAGGRGAHDLEARGKLGNLVAVAHPDLEHAVAFLGAEVLNAFEKLGVAVADAENRNAGFEHGLAGLVVAFFIGAHVRAGKNDALRVVFADEFRGHVVGVNFTVDVGFAHAAGDELGHLAAEVENEDAVVRHVSVVRVEKEIGDCIL